MNKMWMTIRLLKHKPCLVSALLTGAAFFMHPMSSVAQTANADSAAVYFSNQAGAIAGAAEACGQSLDVMIPRVNEVLNTLGTSPADIANAAGSFESARQSARANTAQSPQICPKVLADFNNLPLMQANYRTLVIAPLAAAKPVSTPAAAPLPSALPGAVMSNPAAPSTTTTPQRVPINNSAAPQQAAANPIFPSNASPVQNYVAGVAPQNPANTAAINPGYNNANVPNNGTNTATNNNAQSAEMAKLQLAQQLTQMAQTLMANGQPSVSMAPGQVSQYNPIYNPQLNEQLNGMGANNPIFTGGPLGK